MSAYFDYQNPPISRDTQADIDRIPDHFARLASMYDALERAAAAGDADAMRQVEKLAEARLGLA